MTQTAEWKLDAFLDWLPVAKWSPETIMNDYTRDGNRYCKVCDEWVRETKKDKHVKVHIAEVRVLVAKRKLEAEERRQEALAAAREERRIEKEAMKSLGLK